MDAGVSLSHLNLLLLTASDSSPIRSHDREYACPSLAAGPLGVIASVNVGAVLMKEFQLRQKFLTDLLVTEISKASLLTVLLLLVASQVYWPLLDGEVCLRGVKEKVADVSPLRSPPFLCHL